MRRSGKACASGSGRASYPKLKPHPGSAGDAVAAHQLARIHAATIDLVAEGGHAGLSALAIARAAGVSRRTFYHHFADKDECFLCTYDMIVRELVRGVLAAQGTDPDRMERLRSGFAVCAREMVERPDAARLALVEIYVDLPGARERLRHYAGLLEALLERSFSEAPDGIELPPRLYLAIVGACTAVARARLLAGAGEEFREEVEELAAWALSLRDPAAQEAFSMPPLPGPLPEGRTVPPVGERPGCEREAIVAVAAEIAAVEGYEAVTAERIGGDLGLPKARVAPQLPGRVECLIAALEAHGGRAIAEVRAAFSAQADWPGAVRAGLAALCARLDADAVLARLALAEVFGSGPVVTAWRTEQLRGLAALVRATAPPGSRPTRLQAEASVAAVWAVLAAAYQEEPGDDLRALVPGLAYLFLAPVIGAPATAAALRRPPRSGGTAGDQAGPTGGIDRGSPPDGRGREREPVPGC